MPEDVVVDETPAEAPPPDTPADDAAAPLDEDAQLDAALAEQTIDLPEGEKLVPLSAVTTVREKLKESKAALRTATEGSARAQQLEQRIDELSQQLAQVAPKAQAYDAAVAAQQPVHHAPPEEDAEALAFAQNLDLYTAEGKPDVAKAKAILGIVDKRATQQAQAQVGPLARHTISQQSQVMLARAKATVLPNGAKPDPEALDAIWGRLDPAITATKEGAQQAFVVALGYSRGTAQAAAPVARATDGTFTKADLPAPLHTEQAGGKDTPSLALNETERKYLKASGMTEAEYVKAAQAAPWLRK